MPTENTTEKSWSEQCKIVYNFFCFHAIEKSKKPTNRGFCDFLGITTGKLQNWSKGQWPSAEDLETIHDMLGFSYRWLVTGNGEPFEEAPATPDDAGELANLRHEVGDLKEELMRAYQDNALLSRELVATSEERRKLAERLEQNGRDCGERLDNTGHAASA